MAASKKQIPLRINAKMYEQLAIWAQDEFRSINAQIEHLLSEALRKHGRSSKLPPPANEEGECVNE